jgi:hypothetical protein
MTKMAFTISLDPKDIERLTKIAREKDLPPRTLARVFILKGIRSETPREDV